MAASHLFSIFPCKSVPTLAFLKYRGISLVSIYVDGYTATALSIEKLSGSSSPSLSSTSTSKAHTRHPEGGGTDGGVGGTLNEPGLKRQGRQLPVI